MLYYWLVSGVRWCRCGALACSLLSLLVVHCLLLTGTSSLRPEHCCDAATHTRELARSSIVPLPSLSLSMDRLLTGLAYPFSHELKLDSRHDVIHLVTWLEDRKIRRLEVKERDGLRKDGATWDVQFASYLDVLECPFTWNVSPEGNVDCLVWLVEHAVAAEYEDCAELCTTDLDTSEPMAVDDDDNDDGGGGGSNISDAEVDALGALLGMQRVDKEHNVTYLQRISKTVSLCLTPGCREALKTGNSQGIPLEDFPLGFDTADIKINQAAVVLKMLHLWDFREMQNDLNAHIVLGQEYTANPRTNAGLGKVGR